MYGKELIIDLHNCNSSKFNRVDIEEFLVRLCRLIFMVRCKLHWWDDFGVSIDEQQTEPHLKGTTAVQFISTSNITIHTLDLLKCVYINVFSCKDFNDKLVGEFARDWFEGIIVSSTVLERK